MITPSPLRPKVLLFDLGGVIVPWVGIEALMRLTGKPRDKIIDVFSSHPIFVSYEIGQCSDAAFISALKSTFALTQSETELATLWCDWVEPPFPDVLATLATLRKTYTVACLSNTNNLHWQHLQGFLDTDSVFDFAFASHHIHAAKPHVESFKIPLEKMGVSPSDVWFFDDTMVNIEAARSFGITSYPVDRAVGGVPTLKGLESLST